MQGFYWLIEGMLGASGRPGGPEKNITDQATLLAAVERDLAWLRAEGIGAVLSLTETPLPDQALAHQGLAWLHLPVPDLHAPTPAQLREALGFIDAQRAEGREVVVHCLVGQGRTGTVLAAYLIRSGMTPDAAIARLRELSPGAISAQEQVDALHAYAKRRDWFV